MAEFVDLNISHLAEKASLQKLVEAAAHLGYSTVAINYVVDYEENKKEIVKPVSPKELFTALPLVQGKSKPIKILSRLTLVVSDPSHCNILRSTSTNIKFYDIFAVFPKSGKLFHLDYLPKVLGLVKNVWWALPLSELFKENLPHLLAQKYSFLPSSQQLEVACTTLDVDIVCINVTEKLPFYIKRPSVNVAIDRGIYFELTYVPAIKDSTMRRYTVSNALSLMQICRGKNIILSSAAEKPLQLRGPYDVANLGWLFGLSESNAKAAVSTNSRGVLLHGEARKTASGVVYTKKKTRATEEDETTPVSKKAKTAL